MLLLCGIIFIVILGLAYLHASLKIWSFVFLCLGVLLHWSELFAPIPLLLKGLFWFFVLFLFLLNINEFRQTWISRVCYYFLRKHIHPLSRTEQEAIDAGEVWFESQLFQGQPDWNSLLSYPTPKLTSEESQFLENEVKALCELLDDWVITHENFDLSSDAWQYLIDNKFFGLSIPKEYEGLGFSATACSAIVQKIATRSITAAVTVMVPNSLGPGELLLAYGTEAQKKHYLPRLANGLEIPCFALTALEAGSDASAIPDVGIVCLDFFEGKEILGIRLNWNKRYITLAPLSTLIGLAFKLYDPDKLLGENCDLGITVCLVPAKHPGISIGSRHYPLNQPFMNGPTVGQNVFIPLDWIVGGEKNAGRGWRMLVECLSAGRGISLPALSAAITKLCFRVSGAYAKIRKQFNTSIGNFEGVEEALARIGGYNYLLEATRMLTLSPIAQGLRPAIASAIAKYHMTELARSAVNDAMDILAGKGIMLGPKNYLARIYQSLPISITVEGANILTRNLIIFGQGIVRCHPFLRETMIALWHKDESEGLKKFDTLFGLQLRYGLKSMARLLLHSFTGGKLVPIPAVNKLDPKLHSYLQQLERMSIALSFVAEIALIFVGGKLKRRERLSARLGDVLSNLYLGAAVLKYYQDQDKDQDQDQDQEQVQDLQSHKQNLLYAEWALEFCLYRIQTALLEFFRNFRGQIGGFLMRLLVFPYGLAYKPPSDLLDHRIASSMMTPSSFRDRLSAPLCISHAVLELDRALEARVAASFALTKFEAFQKKRASQNTAGKLGNHSAEGQGIFDLDNLRDIDIAEAEHFINANEASLLREYERLRVAAIQVDEFEDIK